MKVQSNELNEQTKQALYDLYDRHIHDHFEGARRVLASIDDSKIIVPDDISDNIKEKIADQKVFDQSELSKWGDWYKNYRDHMDLLDVQQDPFSDYNLSF